MRTGRSVPTMVLHVFVMYFEYQQSEAFLREPSVFILLKNPQLTPNYLEIPTSISCSELSFLCQVMPMPPTNPRHQYMPAGSAGSMPGMAPTSHPAPAEQNNQTHTGQTGPLFSKWLFHSFGSFKPV